MKLLKNLNTAVAEEPKAEHIQWEAAWTRKKSADGRNKQMATLREISRCAFPPMKETAVEGIKVTRMKNL